MVLAHGQHSLLRKWMSESFLLSETSFWVFREPHHPVPAKTTKISCNSLINHPNKSPDRWWKNSCSSLPLYVSMSSAALPIWRWSSFSHPSHFRLFCDFHWLIECGRNNAVLSHNYSWDSASPWEQARNSLLEYKRRHGPEACQLSYPSWGLI